jgi:hypothetical protein
MDDICRHTLVDVKSKVEVDIKGGQALYRIAYNYKCLSGCKKQWTEYGDWSDERPTT